MGRPGEVICARVDDDGEIKAGPSQAGHMTVMSVKRRDNWDEAPEQCMWRLEAAAVPFSFEDNTRTDEEDKLRCRNSKRLSGPYRGPHGDYLEAKRCHFEEEGAFTYED